MAEVDRSEATLGEAPAARPEAPLADFKEDWHALAWRPAGSMSLSERWLSAGAPFKSQRTEHAPKPPPAPAVSSSSGKQGKRRRR